jgi:protocatechuate 3,4-dioxygenase beta subunit
MRRHARPTAFSALLLLTALLAFSACSDSTSPDGGSPGGSVGVNGQTGSVMGKVTTTGGNGLFGVTVRIGSVTTTTDSKGEFLIQKVGAGQRVLVNVGGSAYTTTQKIVPVTAGRTSWVDASVIPYQATQTVSGASGGTVSFAGATAVFPTNAFVDSKGNAFTGSATVKAAWFDPTAAVFYGCFPGEFSGVRTTGGETGIESFGFMSVELYNGAEKLQLASGKTSTLTFPIPAALRGRAPATIPLWYYDEAKGKWMEEGQATRSGNNYVGTVAHFSSWNCDQPTQTSFLEGHVVDKNGKPLAFANVKHTGVDYTGGSTVRTDEQGYFKISVKSASTARVWATYYTSASPTQDVSTPATGAVLDIGTITIPVDPADFSTITGRIVDNGGLPVKNVYVTLKDSLGTVVDQTNVNDLGRFQFFGDAGHSYVVSISWYGDSTKSSTEVNVIAPASGQTLDMGDIQIDLGGATIKGRVVDGSGNPLANVNVYAPGSSTVGGNGQRESQTGPDGLFSLWVRPNVTVQIHLYYNQQSKTINATSGALGSTVDIGDVTMP